MTGARGALSLDRVMPLRSRVATMVPQSSAERIGMRLLSATGDWRDWLDEVLS
jgi:hypothetical protein